MWARAPRFCAGRLCARVFGYDDSWLRSTRDEFPLGSWQWLALTEELYGGFTIGAASGKNRGGDRMSPRYHGYGFTYAEFLEPLLTRREDSLTLVEVGILNGSGLAIWCDLFPKARVIGLDIDPSNYEENRQRLLNCGAFSVNQPEVYRFDQLDVAQGRKCLVAVLQGQKIDVAIDDGCHTIDSIALTMQVLCPHFADSFAYFIEDNFDTYDVLARQYPQYRWAQRGEMVVVTNR